MEIIYDDSNLERMFAELEPKRRRQALKGAFRRAANKVRKVAVANLRSSGLRTDRNLEKGIRSAVFRKKAGFRVTIGSKKTSKRNTRDTTAMHTNRSGRQKPILVWAEGGTDRRRQKGRLWRKGRSTGKMPKYGFMAKTRREVSGSVTETLRDEVRENVKRISLKYGCK